MPQQQSGQNAPQNNNKKRFNWVRLVVTLLLIFSIGIAAYFCFSEIIK